jgi:hypothetical protein
LILFAGFLDKKSGSMTVYKILEKVAWEQVGYNTPP